MTPLPTMGPEEFRQIRRELGKTQTEMAAIMGAGLRTVTHWENGDREIPGPAVVLARLLARLAKDKKISAG